MVFPGSSSLRWSLRGQEYDLLSVNDLVFQEEFAHLLVIADKRGWQLKKTEHSGFALVLPAADNSKFALSVKCDGYPTIPPAWNWCSTTFNVLNQPSDTPCGSGGFFHGSGRICAPWNRVAYKSVDAQGPHDDWLLANWIENPRTEACTTLAAMALRIFVELSSERYQGRQQ